MSINKVWTNLFFHRSFPTVARKDDKANDLTVIMKEINSLVSEHYCLHNTDTQESPTMSSSTYSTAQTQFNDYKFSMLMNKYQHELESFSPHQKLLALDILKDLCWARNIDELSSRWQQRDVKPDNPSSCLTLLHFNIFHFYSNQTDLVSIVQKHSPTIISINELGTAVLTKTIKQSLFSYNIYKVEGTNSHDGVVLAIDKKVPSTNRTSSPHRF